VLSCPGMAFSCVHTNRLLKKGFQVPEPAPFGVRSDVESILCET
jgi:hypothetical protein